MVSMVVCHMTHMDGEYPPARCLLLVPKRLDGGSCQPTTVMVLVWALQRPGCNTTYHQHLATIIAGSDGRLQAMHWGAR